MKCNKQGSSKYVEGSCGRANKSSRKKVFLFSALVMILSLGFVMVTQGQNRAQDPGPRGGPVAAGDPIAGLDAGTLSYFNDGLTRFQEIETVTNSINTGLGPTFNSNQCSSCHAQPAIGGTSPAVNPQIGVANLDGATNSIPTFISLNGPVREARFKFAVDSNGSLTNVPDGGVPRSVYDSRSQRCPWMPTGATEL